MPAKYDFENKTALVTGAGKGIGRAIVLALLESNARVIAVSRTAADLDSLAADAGDRAAQLTKLVCDVSAADAASVLSGAIAEAGGVALVVNNAGIARLAPLLDTSLEDLKATYDVNVGACLTVIQVAAKDMIARKVKGAIVNVSSQASAVALPEHTAYCCSKAALDMLTKQAAMELGEHGIRVTSVNPTVVMTDMGRAAWGKEEKARPMLNRISLNRFAEVDEVVQPVLFLLDGGAGMVNGSCVWIEGGLLGACTLK